MIYRFTGESLSSDERTSFSRPPEDEVLSVALVDSLCRYCSGLRFDPRRIILVHDAYSKDLCSAVYLSMARVDRAHGVHRSTSLQAAVLASKRLARLLCKSVQRRSQIKWAVRCMPPSNIGRVLNVNRSPVRSTRRSWSTPTQLGNKLRST